MVRPKPNTPKMKLRFIEMKRLRSDTGSIGSTQVLAIYVKSPL